MLKVTRIKCAINSTVQEIVVLGVELTSLSLIFDLHMEQVLLVQLLLLPSIFLMLSLISLSKPN